jgi:hypothetical protein
MVEYQIIPSRGGRGLKNETMTDAFGDVSFVTKTVQVANTPLPAALSSAA